MTGIEWTEQTWNPVTGCDRISPGCDHCYALTLAKRLKAMGNPKYQAGGNPVTSGPGFAVTAHDDALALPTRWRKPRLVFVNSMSDLFHARVSDAFIAAVFAVMAATPRHTYQVLTKRPRRMRALMDSDHFQFLLWCASDDMGIEPQVDKAGWPLPNVWLGTTIEDNGYAWRAAHLRQAPAAVRFLSLEPLLGPLPCLNLDGIGWVIAGGESGPGYRPPEAAWFRDLRDRCTAAGIPFFFKQWGGPTPKAGGRLLDGRTWDQMPAAVPVWHEECRQWTCRACGACPCETGTWGCGHAAAP
jgi:protein gp37